MVRGGWAGGGGHGEEKGGGRGSAWRQRLGVTCARWGWGRVQGAAVEGAACWRSCSVCTVRSAELAGASWGLELGAASLDGDCWGRRVGGAAIGGMHFPELGHLGTDRAEQERPGTRAYRNSNTNELKHLIVCTPRPTPGPGCGVLERRWHSKMHEFQEDLVTGRKPKFAGPHVDQVQTCICCKRAVPRQGAQLLRSSLGATAFGLQRHGCSLRDARLEIEFSGSNFGKALGGVQSAGVTIRGATLRGMPFGAGAAMR